MNSVEKAVSKERLSLGYLILGHAGAVTLQQISCQGCSYLLSVALNFSIGRYTLIP